MTHVSLNRHVDAVYFYFFGLVRPLYPGSESSIEKMETRYTSKGVFLSLGEGRCSGLALALAFILRCGDMWWYYSLFQANADS